MKQFKTYLGTGAAMTLGLGVVPKYLKIVNCATGLTPVFWSEGKLASSAIAGGIIDVAGTYTPQTSAQGVQRYYGGDIIATLSTSKVVDPAVLSADKTNLQGAATTFTWDVAASGTGHFNGLLASGAGAGSMIYLAYLDTDGRPASWTGRIAAAGTVTSTNGVTLDQSLPAAATSIRVVYVGAQYDLISAPVGTVMPAGVILNNTTYMTSAVQYLIEFEGDANAN